jgi:DNA-binding transcriptional ArsR family regulator
MISRMTFLFHGLKNPGSVTQLIRWIFVGAVELRTMTEADVPSDTAADAFDVLSDPLRVDILRELVGRTHLVDGSGVPFSDLRRAVGVDDTGRFNYHLGELRDSFVAKREDDYVPTYAGMRAVGTVEAGFFTQEPPAREGHIDTACPVCGDPLEVSYEDSLVSMGCPEHGPMVRTSVPPRVAEDADLAEIVAFANAETQRDLERMANGTCPVCYGDVASREFERDDASRLFVTLDCEHCWMRAETPIGTTVVRHPAVVALYHEHGLDIREQYYVNLEFAASMENATVVAEDPVRVELRVDLEGDAVVLTLDESLDVVATERA